MSQDHLCSDAVDFCSARPIKHHGSTLTTSQSSAGLVIEGARKSFVNFNRAEDLQGSRMAQNFLDTRRIIKPDELKGPRVYSTDLMPSHFGPADPNESLQITARALKIKIITKGLVTLNSTYLVSPLGVRLVDAYPDIFNGPAILPAFRTDKSTLEDLISSTAGHEAAGIDEKHLQAHIAKLEGMIGQAMPWQLGEVGETLRATLLKELQNPQSVIRRELARQGVSDDMAGVAGEIENLDFADSKHLRDYIARIEDARIREPLKRLVSACYHFIGTSVVKCEAGTDLNPISSFKSADLILTGRDEGAERLSDTGIFLEAFMGSALNAIQASILPAQIIDTMTFDMAHKLSAGLRTQGFQEKYDRIMSAYAISLSAQPQQALEELDEEMVATTARELGEAFKKEILDEIPAYETAIHAEAKDDLYRSGVDVAKAIAGLTPLHPIVAISEVIKSGAEASAAGAQLAAARTPEKALELAQKERQEKINYAIEKLNIGPNKRSKLLDAAATFSDIYTLKTKRA